MMAVLEARNLKKVYQRKPGDTFSAVDGISLALKAGECLGIVGESGCGKSTTAAMLARLLPPSEGRIFLNGEDITKVDGNALRAVYLKLQMVFQSPLESFDPRRRIGDGIGESLRNAGYSKQEVRTRVEALLLQCELAPAYAARYPHELSGGECQRAAIARAIVIAPQILILDEPTSSLDVTVQAQILSLLRALQAEHNMSYLFISHDLALIQQMCDRVLVMQRGRIVEEGTPHEIIIHPREAYTKQLIDSALF